MYKMTNKKTERLKLKSIAFYGTVVIALAVIGYFSLNLNKDSKKESVQTASSSTLQNSKSVERLEPTPTSDTAASTTGQTQTDKDKGVSAQDNPKASTAPSQYNQSQSNSVQSSEKAKPTEAINQKQPEKTPVRTQTTPVLTSKVKPTEKPDNTAIKIVKSEVTATSKFYPYELDGVSMEVVAVKASDGTIRTALNTCQVCFDSGRGYYEQVGEYLVCQNCRNRFHVDQVEKVKGGCNPVPILEENKQDTGDYITISKDFMAGQKEYFSNWKKK